MKNTNDSLRFYLASLLSFGWLVPNHYPPWSTAYSDALPIALLLVLGLLSPGGRLPRLVACFVGIAVIAIGVQAATGRIVYGGDALMAALYLALFALATSIGGYPRTSAAGPDPVLTGMMAGWIFAAAVSVFIAAVQWTQVWSLGIYAADLPPNFRPFGNVAQPNHLATITALGLCAALYFYERGRLGWPGLAALGIWLLFGMALTQSRASWVYVLFLTIATAIATLIAKRRVLLRLSPVRMAVALVASISVLSLVPRLSGLLLLDLERTDQTTQFNRLSYWASMLDAISLRPWFGYGWQQTSFAQFEIALDHPPIHESFDQSHNLLLDFLIWNGVPIGLLLFGLLLWWMSRKMVSWTSAQGWFAWLAVGLLCLHSLIEYPLHYAYFLIPCGLAIGVVHRESLPTSELVVHRSLLRGLAAVLLVIFAAIGIEYAKIESDYRTLRFAAARIGTASPDMQAIEVHLLTQLRPLMAALQDPPRTGMSAEELDEMRWVAMRYPNVPLGLRYAFAAGLNGKAGEAADVLQRLCDTHSAAACRQLQGGWRQRLDLYPELKGIAIPRFRELGQN